ncbi:NAD-dependent epimerase/dehydratase family protein [archaeon]|nr:NAD-dependent epimerase/dehydratase family protein [archaeon]
MKILITGGKGFIGKHLGTYLVSRGHEILLPRDLIEGFDVNNIGHVRNLEKEKFDAIVHLASKVSIADSLNDPLKYFNENLKGVLQVLDLARRKNVRVVFPSSALYGEIGKSPLKEEFEVDPPNPYSMSKYIGEQLCKSYARNYGVKVVVLRLFNVYGEGQRYGVLPRILKGIEEKKIEFKFGVSSKRDFVYIKDVVRSFELALEYSFEGKDLPFDIFNVGTGKSYSVKEFLDIVCEKLNKKPEVLIGEEQMGTVDDSCADVSKIRNNLGWEAKFNLEEGLGDMVND